MVKRGIAILMWALMGCIAVSLSGFVDDSHAEASSPVFVVYGRMTTQAGAPMNGGYTIVVKNLQTGLELQNELGVDVDAGKYAVAFLPYSAGGGAAEVEDIIQVTARLTGEPNGVEYERHEVTVQDVLDMRVRIDIVEGVVPVDSRTWGGIKALYRLE